MSATPGIQEAVERAERAQRNRVEAVRELAAQAHELDAITTRHETERQDLDQRHKNESKAAENNHLSAYSAALKQGWTSAELKKIGFPEPVKKKRTQRRQSSARTITDAPAGASHNDTGNNTAQSPEDAS